MFWLKILLIMVFPSDFNVKKPDEKDGLLSTDIEFEEGYIGSQLTKNTTVKK